jgi:hypothetical protein
MGTGDDSKLGRERAGRGDDRKLEKRGEEEEMIATWKGEERKRR